MKLFYRELASRGRPLIILHGLFGSSDNWHTQGKMLAENYHVYLPDQRNHGQSPHSHDFDLALLADDIHEFILTNSISDPVLLGHSMGGKAAMKFALAHPELIHKLIVVDIAPRAYPVEHGRILEGLKAIPIDTMQSRNEADEALAAYVTDADVRQFLLKNLQRKPEGGFGWKINLPVLDKNIDKISGSVENDRRFEKPALFVRGSRSQYVKDEDAEMIEKLFPQSHLVTMDTGHWVQAEKPKEFVEEVQRFIA